MMRTYVAWNEMPQTMTFDDLLALDPEAGYIEKYGKWQMILSNGVFYTGKMGEEVARKCDALSVLDTNLKDRW